MMVSEKNWDIVPDDELDETYMERLEGLKEMIPETIRKKIISTTSWSFWAVKKTVSFQILKYLTNVLQKINFEFFLRFFRVMT